MIYFSVSITDCKYTCHRRCRGEVDLDCTGGWQFERNLSVDEMTMKTLHLIDQVMVINWYRFLVFSLVIMISSRCTSGMASGERMCLPSTNMAWVWIPDHCHIWVEFLVGSHPFSEGFFLGCSVFLRHLRKLALLNFKVNHGWATVNSQLCYLLQYLFYP